MGRVGGDIRAENRGMGEEEEQRAGTRGREEEEEQKSWEKPARRSETAARQVRDTRRPGSLGVYLARAGVVEHVLLPDHLAVHLEELDQIVLRDAARAVSVSLLPPSLLSSVETPHGKENRANQKFKYLPVLSFCCTPLSLWQVLQWGCIDEVSKIGRIAQT